MARLHLARLYLARLYLIGVELSRAASPVWRGPDWRGSDDLIGGLADILDLWRITGILIPDGRGGERLDKQGIRGN